MTVLIELMILLNLMLGGTLLIAKLVQLDQRHAQENPKARERRRRKELKAHFRDSRRD